MSSKGEELPDLGTGISWKECSIDQKLNRLVGAVYSLQTSIEVLQELIITHGHATQQPEEKGN